MVERCLMASHGYPPCLFSPPELRVLKDSLPFFPIPGVNQDIVKSSCASVRFNQRLDLWKPMSRLLAGNAFVRILSTAEGPELIDARVLLSFGIAEQCTRQENILKYLRSGSNDVESGEINISILFDLMGPLVHAINMHQQQFPSYLEQQSHDAMSQPSLVYPSAALHLWEPSSNLIGLNSGKMIHSDGRLLISGASASIEMKDILSIISEFYFSNDSMKCTKHAMLVPYFDSTVLILWETMLKYPGLHPFTQSCKRVQAFRLYGFALVDASCVPLWERHMQEDLLASIDLYHKSVDNSTKGMIKFGRLGMSQIGAGVSNSSSASFTWAASCIPDWKTCKTKSKSSAQKLDVNAASLRSSQKTKYQTSPQRKSNKRAVRESEIYRNNYLHACESLLSIIVDKKRHGKTAILSLKKSGPQLPHFLTTFSATIAGTGIAVLFSIACRLACGRIVFSAPRLLNTGLGLGLIWLSWAVNNLRDTVVVINRSPGKLDMIEDDMMNNLDKNVKEIYFRAATLLAVVVLRLA
ncbi:hypothetical protein RDI58_022886 [Solanum bulbocastanum]|uniref:Uncharacterized protein n=1 Tax=Solanum bulbocastanum TaxID=147425 RepID=A0AAN8Y681_SOLBU